MDNCIRNCGFSVYLSFSACVISMDNEIQKFYGGIIFPCRVEE
jgi:hypothetical protein